MRESKHIGFSFVMVMATALVIVGVMQAVNSLVQSGAVAGSSSPEAVLARIKPIGQLNTGAPIVAQADAAAAPAAAATSGAARSGEQVFNTVCTACHGTGAAGAPKVGDKTAWGPRIKQGINVLLNHAMHGFTGKTGTMPPRGTCGNCSDQELKNAIEYMVSKAK